MNITYLLGAGASAKVIQPVNGMKEGLSKIAKQLLNYTRDQMNDGTFHQLPIDFQNRLGLVSDIARELEWLLKEARFHETIDTLAKYYYLTGETASLIRLKRAMITYFALQQLCVLQNNPLHNEPSPIENLLDRRYDSFIATIAGRDTTGFKLPGNIKILTWNYDLQLELALKRYVPFKMHEIKERFQLFPNHNSFDLATGDLADLGSFAAVKLNGNAFWDNPSITREEVKVTIFDKFYSTNRPMDVLSELAWQYQWLNANGGELIAAATSYFNFAWEMDTNFRGKHTGHGNNIRQAIKIAENTQVLVVIGYFFPVFNRAVDRQLFADMPHLAKVYIMDPHAEKIRSTMLNAFELFQQPSLIGRNDIVFQLETGTDQFIIPYEID